LILGPDRNRAPAPKFKGAPAGISVGSVRRIILIGMLLVAGGYRLGVHVGWITPVTARAPAATTAAAKDESSPGIATVSLVQPDGGEVARAFEQHLSRVQVRGTGSVARILPDDEDGSRHQRFILRMDSGPSVLFAHNIELAGRIPGLAVGERVEFSGEYAWNEKGGVVHWTHRDPAGRHQAGWIKVAGVLYR
jgi:hypothetical protein